MKPKIDLNSPLFKAAQNIFDSQVELALNATQRIENAVLPIYSIPKSKAHNKKKTKPEQTASGVLVKIQNKYFIFTATHVFDGMGKHNILTGAGDGTLIKQLKGERFSTNDSENSKKDFDASVYYIESELEDNLKSKAITLEDFDFDGYDESKPVYIVSGFRAKRSNTQGNSINSKRGTFTSLELDIEEYETKKYNSISHIILAYEKQHLANNRWIMSPTPNGISGGAIIKVKGTSFKQVSTEIHRPEQLLTAITNEYHQEENKKSGILVGTRINIYLGLIYQFIPEILEDFMNSKGIEIEQK